MWLLENDTPFAADCGWVRDHDGAEVWLVAVKATFDINPDGSTSVAQEQPPVLRTPEYHGEPGKSSIKYEADLVLTKTCTDVIVLGHAYAPHNEPVAQCDAGFKVGPIQKMLRILGDRGWTAHGPAAPRAFARMPLMYERAFGGVDPLSPRPDRDWEWRNPVGTGFAVSWESAKQVLLPNIEDPRRLIRGWNDRPPPAGFGALAGSWQPRVSLAGTYDDEWAASRKPLLPHDFDDRFFQYAPPDQQSQGFLRGDEPVVLSRLTPGGDLRFVLPRLFLGFETSFYGGGRTMHTTRNLHSVILEPDHPRVSLVWHSSLPCHFKVHQLEQTDIFLKTGLNSKTPSLYSVAAMQ
jgi:hypothetical protein